MFADAHPSPKPNHAELPVLGLASECNHHSEDATGEQAGTDQAHRMATPGQPLRFQNDDPNYDASGWIFHVDDVFDRDKLLDLLGYVYPIVRLKGVFRCEDDW